MPTLLSEDILDDALKATSMQGWSGDTNKISHTVTGLDSTQEADLERQVMESANALNHHPVVEHGAEGTTYSLWTHSAGGVTELDVMLASRITNLVRKVRGQEPPPVPIDEETGYVVSTAAESADGLWAIEHEQEIELSETGMGVMAGTYGGAGPSMLPSDRPGDFEPGLPEEQEPR